MNIELDSAKDKANIAKHGVSLSIAAQFVAIAVLVDTRFAYGETRYRSLATSTASHTVSPTPIAVRSFARSACAAPTLKKGNSMASKKPVVDHDNPEWTKADFARAVKVPAGTSLIDAAKMAEQKHRGRPKLAKPKKTIALRVDDDVLAAYRALGDGWQTRMNDDLRKARKLKQAS
jgi:uncharacterized protein (DUF4415 family)/uncharacterized DUF497 family protein